MAKVAANSAAWEVALAALAAMEGEGVHPVERAVVDAAAVVTAVVAAEAELEVAQVCQVAQEAGVSLAAVA